MTAAPTQTPTVLEASLPLPGRGPSTLRPGLTTVLRVQNEGRSLARCLSPLLRATDEVVLVDNLSTDDTVAVAHRVAREVAEQTGTPSRLRVHSYPFTVSRCGEEHLRTPPESVHSLVHLNNWAFSHVETTHALKWDGDMVLSRDGEDRLAATAWEVLGQDAVVRVPRHPLYVESDQVAYLDLGLSNVEFYGVRLGAQPLFVKGFEWEVMRRSADARHRTLPTGLCVELKYLDSDEFAHWTSPADFLGGPRSRRKRREWAVFNGLRDGSWPRFDSLHRIEAPSGVHVIDHVLEEWLPGAPRPLVQDLEVESG